MKPLLKLEGVIGRTVHYELTIPELISKARVQAPDVLDALACLAPFPTDQPVLRKLRIYSINRVASSDEVWSAIAAESCRPGTPHELLALAIRSTRRGIERRMRIVAFVPPDRVATPKPLALTVKLRNPTDRSGLRRRFRIVHIDEKPSWFTQTQFLAVPL